MKDNEKNGVLTDGERDELLHVLEERFNKNKDRHKGIEWDAVLKKLEARPDKLWSLNEMERTGGEPDVVAQDKQSGEILFFDCAAESPAGPCPIIRSSHLSIPIPHCRIINILHK